MNDVDETINIYVDVVRAIYQNKDAVICWARDHVDAINTSEPLSEVEKQVKQAVSTARRVKNIENLHALDKSIYDMECVLEVLERAYQTEMQWKQGELDFIWEAV